MEFVTWAILAGASTILTLLRIRTTGAISVLAVKRGQGKASTLVGLLLLLATGIGVCLSYLAISRVFTLSIGIIAGAVGVTIVSYLGTYGVKKEKTRFDLQEFLAFTRDGFLWTTAYPSLAAALGVTSLTS